jgi:protein phosphatase
MKFSWKKNNGKPPEQSEDLVMAAYGCKVYALSETGPTRSLNEDSIFYAYPDGHFQTFFGMVADGMGGHQAGEVASNIACTTAEQYIQKNFREVNVTTMLEGCIKAAHSAIVDAAKENSMYRGMGTTATMVFIRESNMYFAHIGDSRLYHLKKTQLKQCTSDNTLVNEMLQEGKISEEEALNHDMKHVLTQALGTVNQIEPQLSKPGIPIEAGDILFLCSDGIYDVLKVSEIEKILNMRSSELAIDCIKALCMQRKASDNFSALLIEITGDQDLRLPITKELNVML